MKIHTTQNLIQLRESQPTVSYPNELRLKEKSSEQEASSVALESYANRLSFKGKPKGATKENYKKIIESIKKVVAKINKDPQPEMKKGDKFMDSPFFHRALDLCEQETLVTAIIAALACVLRAGTIAVLPAKNETNKKNNAYAVAHPLASGFIGFFTAFLLTTPFKKGAKYVMEYLRQTLSKDTLKRMYPQLDLASIGQDNARLNVSQWKNIDGRAFCDEIKNCSKLPEFTQLANVSDITFKNILKVDVDWAAQEGKSFNDVLLRDGSKLYDKIDMSRLGIKINEGEFKSNQFLFKDLDRSYFEMFIKDSKESAGNKWGELDINSVYDKEGNVFDFRKWKDVNGKEWKLDLDEVFVASPYESVGYKPRISGEKRFDQKEGVYKFRTYQINGVDDKLGTKMTDEMLRAEEKNEVVNKALTWGPDLLFRVPIAVSTVSLIPWALKICFGLEKYKPGKAQNEKTDVASFNEKNVQVAFKGRQSLVNDDVENIDNEGVSFKRMSVSSKLNNENINDDVNNELAFKKGKPFWPIRKLGEWYGKPLLESAKVSEITDKLNKLPGSTTQHMTTAGSLLTSATYVQQTLNKKDLEPGPKKTLAINQALCFVVPTIAAYTVDNMIKGWVKNQEYRFAGIQQRNIDIGKLEGKSAQELEKLTKGLGTKLKGVRILADLVTFTLIYRYVVPVLITPLANMISDKIVAHKKAKQEANQV